MNYLSLIIVISAMFSCSQSVQEIDNVDLLNDSVSVDTTLVIAPDTSRMDTLTPDSL